MAGEFSFEMMIIRVDEFTLVLLVLHKAFFRLCELSPVYIYIKQQRKWLLRGYMALSMYVRDSCSLARIELKPNYFHYLHSHYLYYYNN